MSDTQQARESRVRSALARMDLRLNKTPSRSWLRSHHGPGYQVLDGNTIIYGCWSRKYEATLEQVEQWTQDLVLSGNR
jgi:hypothetical protein